MSAKINLKKAREIVNEQIIQNKVEELPNKAARDREIYANKLREEEQQAQQAQRQQQQRQSVVFNNRPNYTAQTTRANVGIKLQQAMAKNQNNDLDLQEIHKKNISPSKMSPAKYKDTGKKYGDYFHENYEQYKDMPIYERDDGTYYLKTKNGYQKVGKLNKEGVVDKNIEKLDKKDLLKNYEQNKISDKESLEKAKKLGFKGTSVQKMSKKEVDRYWDNVEELQSRYKLTDKQVDEIWKENKIPNNIKKDDRSLKIVSELGKKLNSQINDDYKDLDIQNRIFLDTFKGSEKERRQMIDFLADTNHSEVAENQDKNNKWLKKSKYNLLENIIGTPGVIQERLATVANVGQKAAEGVGNFVEKAGDLLTEPLTLLEMIGNTKDVTTNRIGKKQFDHDLTQYEYRGKKYWYDPEENRLYEDGTHKELKHFNINVMKKTVGHDNPLANLGQAARETMTENDTQNLFEDNAIDKWIQKNTVLGQNIQSGIESTGEMLPLMAAGIATNNVTPEGTLEQGGKSLVTTNALVFGEAYSGAKTEALRQGMSVEDATKSAFVQAAAETISENFFDSIPGMSSAGWGDEIVSQIAGKIEQKLGSKAGRLMYHALSQSGEGLEEIVSNGLTTMGNEILSYFDKNYASHFPELTGDMSRDMMNSMLSTESFDAFITATFTSMIMNSGSTILNNKQKNEIVKDFAETNGLTTKEAKIILKQNLSEELSTYTPTGNFEDRLNAEQNATSKILGKMITNSVENHIELSEDGESVRFYNKDLTYDEVNEKIDYLTEKIATVDDYDLKINLLEAASKLEIAKNMMDEQLSTLDSSLEEEVEEEVEDAETEEIAPTEEQDAEVQEEEKAFEEEKNKKIVQLNAQLEELRKTKNKQVQNLQLDKRISSQREGIEQIKDKIQREKAIFGFVDESRMKQLENAENRLQDLLKQKKEPQEIESDITKQINTIKKEIENVENSTFEQKPNSLEQIEEPEVSEDTTKKEKSKKGVYEINETLYHGSDKVYDELKSARQLREEGKDIDTANTASNSEFVYFGDEQMANSYAAQRNGQVNERNINGKIIDLTLDRNGYTDEERALFKDIAKELREKSNNRGPDAFVADSFSDAARRSYGFNNPIDVNFTQLERTEFLGDILRSKGIIGLKFSDQTAYGAVRDSYAILPDYETISSNSITRINEIKKESKDLENKKEKNTIEEKIEKTDDKITVKPDEKNIRSWANTATKGDYKGVDLVKEVSEKIDHMYVPEHNVPHWNKALNRVEKDGYKVSFNYLKSKIDNNEKITLDDMMLGQKLLSEAAKNKNYEDVTYLLPELEILGTETGQIIQALSVIRRLSPEGQLRILQRTITRMKQKGIKGAENLHLTQEMIDTVVESTEEDLNKNVDSIKKLLGEQMTGSLEEKLRTWRYFAMLGNPKTHVRNIISNVGMMATRSLKKLHQRALESAIAKINPNAIPERRISFNKISQEVKDHVDNFIKDNISLLAKESKYKMESQIEQYKKIYGDSMAGELANKITEFNSNLLENEDLFFKLPAFKNAVGEFLVANGINTVEDIKTHENMFNKAVDYGIDEALKATFQQYSALAAGLNRLSKKNKVTQFMSEALMPFKRTPINIVKTGVSYSPLGLLKTVTKNSMDLKNGKISVNEYIDNLSQGLTGTELMMLGLVLSKMGILGGKAGDADKEAQFKKAQGKQNYSINIGNLSYNIDWLVPTSVPLLLGVTMNEIRNENTSMNLNTLMPMATSIADPIIELSFLQTLDNALTTFGREGPQGAVEDTVQSYIGQYIPTIFGQVAKTIDPTVRSTSASKNSSWKWGEETLRQIGSKIPGVTYALEPSKDMWGEDVKRDGNPLIRAFNNFFNPGSPETIADDTVNKEIQNIYDQTHEDSVIPKLPSTYYYGLKKDVTYKGEKYASNAKEYTKMKEIYGKIAYDTLNKLFKTNTYKNSSDEDKVKLIEKAYTHATDTMKKDFLSKKGVDYKNKTGYFFYKKLDEPVYEENAIKYVAEHDVDLSTAYKANKKKS